MGTTVPAGRWIRTGPLPILLANALRLRAGELTSDVGTGWRDRIEVGHWPSRQWPSAVSMSFAPAARNTSSALARCSGAGACADTTM